MYGPPSVHYVSWINLPAHTTLTPVRTRLYRTQIRLILSSLFLYMANPSGEVVYGAGLRPLTSWDCGFEYRRGAWISVSFDCCVLSGRGLCDELITSPEESYRLWSVVVCDLETSWLRRLWPNGGGGLPLQKQTFVLLYLSQKKSRSANMPDVM